MTTISDISRQVQRDAATAQRLYQQITPVIGAFDAAEMSAGDVAAYALRKLNLRVVGDSASNVENLRMWLAGRQQAADAAAGRRPVMDSAPGSMQSILDRYLAS